jgi:hypothetical protein
MLKQNSRTQTDSERDVAMDAPEPRKNASRERCDYTFCKHVGTDNHALSEVHLFLPLLAVGGWAGGRPFVSELFLTAAGASVPELFFTLDIEARADNTTPLVTD